MKKILSKCYSVFCYLLFDPIGKIQQYIALPVFIKNLYVYTSLNKPNGIPLHFGDLYITTADKFRKAGTANGHYFFQDIWAATKIYEAGIKYHTDIGSRIDGFVAHLLPFCKVQYVDIRVINTQIENLQFVQGSILDLPYPDNSIDSLSCLHVIEHIGLGRYGDPIDQEGHIKAGQEMVRVLKPGGTLYIGTPVGKERVCFDAHRVFNPTTILKIFEDLTLLEFSLIDDKGDQVLKNANLEAAATCTYGCGLFEFTKTK